MEQENGELTKVNQQLMEKVNLCEQILIGLRDEVKQSKEQMQRE